MKRKHIQLHPVDMATKALDMLCKDIDLGRVRKPDPYTVTLAILRLFPNESLIPAGSFIRVATFKGTSWTIEEMKGGVSLNEQNTTWLQRKLSTYM